VLFGAIAAHDNVLLARGLTQNRYRQRIPIPVAMWGNGIHAHVWGTGIMAVSGKRAAVLLCYEQILTLPALQSFLDKPDVIAAPSNLYWAAGTSIEKSETLCVSSWARLFHVPYLRATNR
jgi:hypothetical protein